MNNATIMIVDDTKANIEYLEEVLEDANYDVRIATSGEAALRSIKVQVPDLILLDIMMPGIDGYETCIELKKDPLYKDIPVIFLSAKDEVADKVKGFEAGAVDYLAKPFNPQEILVRMQTHLSLYYLQKELEQKLDIIDRYVITSSTDLDGIITEASEAFTKISGYSKEELIGKKHSILRHPDTKDTLYQDLWGAITHGYSWHGEIKNLAKDGSYYWVDAIVSPTKNLHGKIVGFNSIRQDITSHKHVQEISITDQLTQLHNRHYFNQIFPYEIQHAIRHNSFLSFIMIDVDFFKQYNDTYGHQDGDDVLSNIGSCLKTQLQRTNDYVFRLGGEEFGMICSTTDSSKSQEIAQRVRSAIENLKMEHSSSSVAPCITISLGMVSVDFSKRENYDLDMDNLYKMADDELYKAKGNGRNQLSFVEK